MKTFVRGKKNLDFFLQVTFTHSALTCSDSQRENKMEDGHIKRENPPTEGLTGSSEGFWQLRNKNTRTDLQRDPSQER